MSKPILHLINRGTKRYGNLTQWCDKCNIIIFFTDTWNGKLWTDNIEQYTKKAAKEAGFIRCCDKK